MRRRAVLWSVVVMLTISTRQGFADQIPLNAGLVVSGNYGFTTLEVPGSIEASALDINDRGQIVGQSSNGELHGFLLTDGTYVIVDPPAAEAGVAAKGINNAGQIVGYYFAGETTHGFLLSNGTYRTIDVPGATITDLSGINDNDQIVGNYQIGHASFGFLLNADGFHAIAVPGASSISVAQINNTGQIVGHYFDGATHGFLLSDGMYFPLDVPGALLTIALGIDDTGRITGWFTEGSALTGRGFRFADGVYSTIDVPGAVLSIAAGSNNSGAIVGAYRTDASYGSGHAFLATPVPEPSSWVLLGAGSLCYLIHRRRRRPQI